MYRNFDSSTSLKDIYFCSNRKPMHVFYSNNCGIRHKIDHTQVNVIQLNTFELELHFTEYIQPIDVRIADLCWILI